MRSSLWRRRFGDRWNICYRVNNVVCGICLQCLRSNRLEQCEHHEELDAWVEDDPIPGLDGRMRRCRWPDYGQLRRQSFPLQRRQQQLQSYLSPRPNGMVKPDRRHQRFSSDQARAIRKARGNQSGSLPLVIICTSASTLLKAMATGSMSQHCDLPVLKPVLTPMAVHAH